MTRINLVPPEELCDQIDAIVYSFVEWSCNFKDARNTAKAHMREEDIDPYAHL